MEYIIRDEQQNDYDQVRSILRLTFPTEAEGKLVDALRANGKAIISLVAAQDDQILGHILFSPVSTTPLNPAKGIGLAPVAVHPDVQSHGIGSALIQEGLKRCKELRFGYCVVLGSPKYYQRFGFQKARNFGIQNEYGVDDEFMIMFFSNQTAKGLVRYAPEFALFSV
jgi:putative acetyltransferase